MRDRLRAALIGIGSLFDLDGRTTRARLQNITGLYDDGVSDAEALRSDARGLEGDMRAIIDLHNDIYHPGMGCEENAYGQCRDRFGDAS